MQRLRQALLLGLVVALAVTSIGWYRATHPAHSGDLSCWYDDEGFHLGFEYPANSFVSPSVDNRGDRVVVGLAVNAPRNNTAQELLGEVRFSVENEGKSVTYADGTALDCPTRPPS